MKKLIVILVSIYSVFTTNLMAQVPNYVPTNGLVAWYPFTGNAIDSSGNGNNGTVNGATLTTDRFGNTNKAYLFDGKSDKIQIADVNALDFSNNYTLSAWYFTNSFSQSDQAILGKGGLTGGTGYQLIVNTTISKKLQFGFNNSSGINGGAVTPSTTSNLTGWHLLTGTYDGISCKLYLDGALMNATSISYILPNSVQPLLFGNETNSLSRFFNGKLDDIGIWNRALSECEILALYNSQLGSFRNTPINVNPPSNMIGTSAVITSSKPLQTIQWQSNSNEIGWVNLSNSAKYNGVTNDTLIVSNLQVSNHNQAFRAIACTDTSNIAYILITDTCITKVTKYDTITTKITKYDTIKVMDTLVINANLSGISAPNNTNRIIVYPNPAKDHITIDYGVFSRMSGYTVKITNTLGQTVFSSPINQQSSFINLSTWTGKGLYYLQIIDPNSNMIENRKIVLQ
jgi:hypothetical protein